MLEYLPFLLILLIFGFMMIKSRVGILRRIYAHPMTTVIPGTVMLYFAITNDEHRMVSILFVLLAIGLTLKKVREAKQETQSRRAGRL